MIDNPKPHLDGATTELSTMYMARARWASRPLKRWVSINKRVLPEHTDAGYTFRYIDIGTLGTGRMVRQPEKMQFANAPSRARRILRRGDTLISTVRTYLKAVYFVDGEDTDLIASTGFAVLSPRSEVVPEFLRFVIQSEPFVEAVVALSTGIAYPAIPEARLGSLRVSMPPLDEQRQIAAFLDHHDRLVRRFVRAKRRQIELLNEQKQAIINQAVMRGLDPNVRLKPSGVEWLGGVPEHWEITRVKNEFQCLNSRRIPLSSSERGTMTSRVYDYYGASGVIDKVDDYIFEDDLLLIAEDGANLVLRNLPLAIIARGKFWVNNHAHILKPNRGDICFLAALMEAIDYRPFITGAAQPKLTKDRLLSVPIAVPPLAEQREIMAESQARTKGIVLAIERTKREIDLVREYRTRLIADVVTGKLDVRGVELPAQVEDDEAEVWDEVVDEEDGETTAAEEEGDVVA